MVAMGKTMPVRHMLVKGLDGRTLCLRIESGDGIVSGASVSALVCARTGIPSHSVRLVTGTAEVRPDSLLNSDGGFFPSCTLLLRLPGGKGGFGSLLRGAATKAGQKKTSNFDACRDMSGRRLRHVNAEKKLKEWKADAEERALEKTAEEYLKKATKAKEEDNGVFEELEKFRAETSQAMEEVESAVASGLVAARKSSTNSKRKVEEDAAVLEKRARIWMGDEHDEEDDSDQEDMEEDERPSSSGEAGDADVSVTTPEQVEPRASVATSKEMVVETVVIENEVDYPVSGLHSTRKLTVTTEITTTTTETVTTVSPVMNDVKAEAAVEEEDRVESPKTVLVPESCTSNRHSPEKVASDSEISTVEVDEHTAKVSNGGDGTETVQTEDKNSEVAQDEPLDFSKYQSAEEMEGLGLEKLKKELQSRGLKCGGSISERAGRLFLLKTSPLEKLDKKHFAGKAKVAKK